MFHRMDIHWSTEPVIPLHSTVATAHRSRLSDQPQYPACRARVGCVSVVLLPLLLAAFFIAVDPYYVFGSPSWRGFNPVRPYYEPYVLTVKPYQVWRQRPRRWC